MLNHALFLSSSGLPGGAGEGSPLPHSAAAGGAWCVHERGVSARRPALARCPGCRRLPCPCGPHPGSGVSSPSTELCALLPSPLPGVPGAVKPASGTPPQSPACSAPAQPSWGLSCSPHPKTPSWGPLCQAPCMAVLRVSSCASTARTPRGASPHASAQSDGGRHAHPGCSHGLRTVGLRAEGPASSSPCPRSYQPHRRPSSPILEPPSLPLSWHP